MEYDPGAQGQPSIHRNLEHNEEAHTPHTVVDQGRHVAKKTVTMERKQEIEIGL